MRRWWLHVAFLTVGALSVATVPAMDQTAGEIPPSRASAEEAAAPALAPAASGAPSDEWTPEMGRSDRELIDRFLILWERSPFTWPRNRWLGIPTLQNPMDVWITQEIVAEVRPDFIVEAGTFFGGSALLWATILEQVNPEGRVITIDVSDATQEARKVALFKRRIDFLLGSSTDPKVVAEVKRRVAGRKTIVILDSLHTRDHVLAELRAYAPIVPVGSYIIVQDSILNGHPVPAGLGPHRQGPGPYEAVEAFLRENDAFRADRSRERLMLTFNPSGFLRRTK